MSKQEISAFIEPLKFKSYGKLIPMVLSHFNPKTKEERSQIKKNLLSVLEQKVHDSRPDMKNYMVKVFSSTPDSWFHDLYINDVKLPESKADDDDKEHIRADIYPKYWHIYINMNTKYAVAYPLESKNMTAVKKSLTEFLKDFKCRRLTSDEEPAFVSKSVSEFLKSKNVSQFIVTDQNHTSLSVLDRFVRTLRDLNTTTEKSKHVSTDDKYKFITPKRMDKLLEIYNSSYHMTIKMSPKEMQTHPKLEEEYIKKCLIRKGNQERIADFRLKEGDFVRYIIPVDKHKKRLYNLSREYSKIERVRGNMYTLIAKDGTVAEFPRWRLIVVKDTSNMKWGDSFGKWNGVVEEIVSINKSTHKAKVKFTVPGQPSYNDEIPLSNLRGSHPQMVSEMEKEYAENRTKRVKKK